MGVCREVVEELYWELGKGVSASDRLGCLSLALLLLYDGMTTSSTIVQHHSTSDIMHLYEIDK